MPWLFLSCFFVRCFARGFILFAALCVPVYGGNSVRSFEIPNATGGLGWYHQSWIPQLISQLGLASSTISYHCNIVPDQWSGDFSSQDTQYFYGAPTEPFNENTVSWSGRGSPVLEVGARYLRTECFLSLRGARSMGAGLLSRFDPSSQVSMGFGVRYHLSPSIAMQLAATLHYVGSSFSADFDPEETSLDLSSHSSDNQPMSDLNTQVNALSSAARASFAEGLFTVVYYFCK